MKRLTLSLFVLSSLGCAHNQSVSDSDDNQNVACASVEKEPVSSCRAEQICSQKGFKTIFKSGREELKECIDRELSVQKANAGVKDNEQTCVTTRVNKDKIKTVCR